MSTTMEIIRCPACGANNRVDMSRVESGMAAVCAKCKAALPLGHQVVQVTDATFAAEVERSSLPVLLDLWAAWCGPCRLIAPIVEQLAGEMAGRVKVAKLNIDENPATAQRFNVSSIPTLLVFKDGREFDRIIGLQPAAAIKQRLERLAR
jgi:thioredoxin 2